MTTYTFHIEWRDGQTMTGTLRTDDPQRFIRALSKDRDIVSADVDPVASDLIQAIGAAA